jgi:hypothetical protein
MALAYTHIAGAATTQVKSGSGILHKIVLGTPVASSTISIIDNTSGSTVNLGLITNTTDVKPYFVEFNARFSTGLRIITSGADDITVVYQ